MDMPENIEIRMFAPCGMNCMGCYVHVKKKKPCNGCLLDDTDKPERCKFCEIKKCAKAKEIVYCFKCPEFPCKKIVNLDRSYQKRYQVSLIENSKKVSTIGFKPFLKQEREKWICSKCGGIISLHDRECSECERKV